ncbi:MAG: 4Fe-4S binding protein [Candidatus Odinarchaeota archaeon]
MEKRQYIHVDLEKCTGCGICEDICSQEKFYEFNPVKSAIRLTKLDNQEHVVLACQNCDDHPCVTACTVKEALKIGEHTLEVDYDKCNFCGWCVDVCEYGAITMNQISADVLTKKMIFCDLCEGKPKCIDGCPKEAITLQVVPEKETPEKVTSDEFF